VVTSLTHVDIEQMRDQVFFEGPERNRRLSRYWLLLLLSGVIATAGVVSDSTATVIGAMIIAPLMTPILGIVLGVVTADRANLFRCLLLLAAGAAAVLALSWLLGHVVPYPVTAATNSQLSASTAAAPATSSSRHRNRLARSAVTTPSTMPRIGVISGAMIMAPITVAVESLTTPAVAITPESSSKSQ